MTKINPLPIVWDHIRTLTRGDGSRPSVRDLVLFYGVPLVGAWAWASAELELGDTVTTVLVTGLALLAGLLLNLLLLVHGIAQNERRSEGGAAKQHWRLLEEIYKNISYAILVAVLALITLITAAGSWIGLEGALEACVVFLLGHFLLTLLMVLKRIHVLLGKEFAQGPK